MLRYCQKQGKVNMLKHVISKLSKLKLPSSPPLHPSATTTITTKYSTASTITTFTLTSITVPSLCFKLLQIISSIYHKVIKIKQKKSQQILTSFGISFAEINKHYQY